MGGFFWGGRIQPLCDWLPSGRRFATEKGKTGRAWTLDFGISLSFGFWILNFRIPRVRRLFRQPHVKEV
jgi:hypothetical protein